MSRRGGAGRRGAAGTAAAGAAVLGLALAALALHPDAHPSRGVAPLAHHSGLVALLVIGTAVLFGVLARRFRAAGRSVTSPAARAGRLADAVGWLLVAGTVLVPVALLLFHGRDTAPAPFVPDSPPPTRAPVGSGRAVGSGRSVADLDSSASHSAGHLGTGLLWLALAVAVAGAAVVAVRWWRGRSIARSGPAPALLDGTVTGPTVGVLADAVASGRAALLDGSDPRSAVIACYQAMEVSLAEAGVDLLDSDSPTDLLRRAARTGHLGEARDAQTLAELFREARYSTHPMDGGHVRRATAALDALAAALARPAAAAAQLPEDVR
ncbi:DUF4129 domain-containing protein [Streptomyces sp. TLI_171]|uniref:DUF4129 domain-containing protein n=1 Tax=Streptomyces sp. TLI_171 TaxID=1938859 RepID=UPI000C5B321B|nr:DUF4129 domain-containing protein [Streptomyces sp. TLI_171]RKE23513.1 uncharacterized protein DUF4129 [Streptomyces sp. TLI_171]